VPEERSEPGEARRAKTGFIHKHRSRACFD
jgi:hypothetical protein